MQITSIRLTTKLTQGWVEVLKVISTWGLLLISVVTSRRPNWARSVDWSFHPCQILNPYFCLFNSVWLKLLQSSVLVLSTLSFCHMSLGENEKVLTSVCFLSLQESAPSRLGCSPSVSVCIPLTLSLYLSIFREILNLIPSLKVAVAWEEESTQLSVVPISLVSWLSNPGCLSHFPMPSIRGLLLSFLFFIF